MVGIIIFDVERILLYTFMYIVHQLQVELIPTLENCTVKLEVNV